MRNLRGITRGAYMGPFGVYVGSFGDVRDYVGFTHHLCVTLSGIMWDYVGFIWEYAGSYGIYVE